MIGHKDKSGKFHPHGNSNRVQGVKSSAFSEGKTEHKFLKRNDMKTRREHLTEYLFATTGGYSISGFGTNPKQGLADAKKRFRDEVKPEMKNNIGEITNRYNTFSKDGTTPTGHFPKTVR